MSRSALVLSSSRTDAQARAQIAAGQRPRLDYLVLADALGADLLDAGVNAGMPGWQRRIEDALATDFRQAQMAWRRRASCRAWVSLSERVGLPLALRARGRTHPPHVMLGHYMTSSRKRQLHRWTGIFRNGFADILCLTRSQEAFLMEDAGLPPERVHRISDSIDEQFFRADASAEPLAGEYVLAVGREMRDYPTLLEAARRTHLPVTIVASSLWSTRDSSVAGADLPANVTVRTDFVSYPDLRLLYQGARFVVVPLKDVDYAAGVNGVLEAMAMGRPTVVTRTSGLSDYVHDGVTNLLAPPGDASALAEAMERLWDDVPLRARLGATGRARVEAEMSMDGYVARIVAIVGSAILRAEGA